MGELSKLKRVVPSFINVGFNREGDVIFTDQMGYLLDKPQIIELIELLNESINKIDPNYNQLEYIQEQMDKREREIVSSTHTHKKDKSGYLYFIKSENSSEFKIGISKNYKARVSSVCGRLPFYASLKLVFFTEDMKTLEKAVHDKLNFGLIKNEWFNLAGYSNSDLIDVVKNIDPDCGLVENNDGDV